MTKKFVLLAFGLLALAPNLAQAAIESAPALSAIEKAPEVKALYAVYYKNHLKNPGACDSCDVTTAAAVAKEEQPSVVLHDCGQTNGSDSSCMATLTKEIFTNDEVIHTLKIEASINQDSKNKIYVQIQSVSFTQDLND